MPPPHPRDRTGRGREWGEEGKIFKGDTNCEKGTLALGGWVGLLGETLEQPKGAGVGKSQPRTSVPSLRP